MDRRGFFQRLGLLGGAAATGVAAQAQPLTGLPHVQRLTTAELIGRYPARHPDNRTLTSTISFIEVYGRLVAGELIEGPL